MWPRALADFKKMEPHDVVRNYAIILKYKQNISFKPLTTNFNGAQWEVKETCTGRFNCFDFSSGKCLGLKIVITETKRIFCGYRNWLKGTDQFLD
jgi:hypothetical protein